MKNFWKSSAVKIRDTRTLALMAAFIAAKIVLGLFRIPVAENLRISLTFVLIALEASVLGPVCGMFSGALTDTLSFILFPDGPYFIGYTLTAMAGELIYSLFLYNQKITVWKISLAKIMNNYLVNVLMGSLWSAILYGRAFYVYASASLIKNTVLLPFEIALLTLVFHLLTPFLERHHFLNEKNR